MALHYIKHILILVAGCVSISGFASLVGISIRTARIKKYKSIIEKKKKKT